MGICHIIFCTSQGGEVEEKGPPNPAPDVRGEGCFLLPVCVHTRAQNNSTFPHQSYLPAAEEHGAPSE